MKRIIMNNFIMVVFSQKQFILVVSEYAKWKWWHGLNMCSIWLLVLSVPRSWIHSM